jgi:hypothetical protein
MAGGGSSTSAIIIRRSSDYPWRVAPQRCPLPFYPMIKVAKQPALLMLASSL